jgi:hypothetical protein
MCDSIKDHHSPSYDRDDRSTSESAVQVEMPSRAGLSARVIDIGVLT